MEMQILSESENSTYLIHSMIGTQVSFFTMLLFSEMHLYMCIVPYENSGF